jgi:mannose-6-phosphate isomerase-like protein (cupin superfamily)
VTTKFLLFSLLSAASMLAADVKIYSSGDLAKMSSSLAKKQSSFASEDLDRYGNHYFMLAHRQATGSAEVHEHEADVFVIESGHASLVSGGKIVAPHTQKPGEIRGTSISGGEQHPVAQGDVIHIPAGVPHQLIIPKGTPFTYFVIKVTGQ